MSADGTMSIEKLMAVAVGDNRDVLWERVKDSDKAVLTAVAVGMAFGFGISYQGFNYKVLTEEYLKNPEMLIGILMRAVDGDK